MGHFGASPPYIKDRFSSKKGQKRIAKHGLRPNLGVFSGVRRPLGPGASRDPKNGHFWGFWGRPGPYPQNGPKMAKIGHF